MQGSTRDTHPISNSITSPWDHRPSSWPCSPTWVRQKTTPEPAASCTAFACPLVKWRSGIQQHIVRLTEFNTCRPLRSRVKAMTPKPRFPRFRTGVYQVQLSPENVHAEVETSLTPKILGFFNVLYNKESIFSLRKVAMFVGTYIAILV